MPVSYTHLDVYKRQMHIFPYSIRPGTKAAAMAQVDMSVREERAARAAAVAERMHQGYLARCVGKTFPVLFEQDRGEGSVGHAPNYMPCLLYTSRCV